eukprot:7391735-Prymnesium_polylepis.2
MSRARLARVWGGWSSGRTNPANGTAASSNDRDADTTELGNAAMTRQAAVLTTETMQVCSADVNVEMCVSGQGQRPQRLQIQRCLFNRRARLSNALLPKDRHVRTVRGAERSYPTYDVWCHAAASWLDGRSFPHFFHGKWVLNELVHQGLSSHVALGATVDSECSCHDKTQPNELC